MLSSRRTAARLVTTLMIPGLCLVIGVPAGSAAAHRDGFPTEISLPNGFRPEGIAIGPGPYAYLGSLADGSIYRADLRTGTGRIISQGPGTDSAGLKTDRHGRLFVSGGPHGNARVIDIRSGRILRTYQLGAEAFVNDVVLTRRAAWFTDSHREVLYRLPLNRGLPESAEELELKGVTYTPGVVNANGIEETPDGRRLLVVQSNTGRLLQVHPRTGNVRIVDLGGETVPTGDGLLLRGRTLYVSQNRMNLVAEIALNETGTKGRLLRRISDPRFDVPTTVAAFKGRLYLPNARFGTEPTPQTPYNIVAITP